MRFGQKRRPSTVFFSSENQPSNRAPAQGRVSDALRHLILLAQWRPFFLSLGRVPPKLKQPKREAPFFPRKSTGHLSYLLTVALETSRRKFHDLCSPDNSGALVRGLRPGLGLTLGRWFAVRAGFRPCEMKLGVETWNSFHAAT